ncbi:aminopeptidase [candidate division KSB1 bacterium]|nr:aminopeptidase [candidate division KSB1 bacterium]
MLDPRYNKLADVLITHSTRLQKGEKILLEAIDVPPEMVIALIRKAVSVGGIPLVTVKQNVILRELYSSGTDDSLQIIGELEADRMKKMDAYVGLRGSYNITELSDVPRDKMRLYQKYWWEPVHIKIRVPDTKWVVLRWPSSSMAQQAGQSTEAFENFYFDVCTLDYNKMSKAMDALVERMNNTDMVSIKGPGTDLSFSIKNIPVIKCSGQHNIPDGEVYTAPVKNSVNGELTYTAKTIYQGVIQDNIKLTFKDGKIINAVSDKTETLNKILDTDEGARYIGEFALGLNPFITNPMLDILFDEKICGSFHFTPGQAYDEADNGNRSKVHWDMVCIQTPEYGGGEIYFDGELIRKDGLFVTEDLIPLNPENLK